MAKLESPYLDKKGIPLEALQRVTKSRVYVRDGTVVLFDDEGEDSGDRHRGPFLFRELVDLTGASLGFERVLDQKVVRQPGTKPNDKFTTSGTDTDGFTPIGDAWDDGIFKIESKIIVCAGIAEGYRLHEATGLPVACCVGEQKIPKLVQVLKSLTRYPDQIIAAVDNDKAGYIAALRSGIPYYMPSQHKDFSDVYQDGGGIEAVMAETRTPIQPMPVEKREAELDRLHNRNADQARPAPDPIALDDARFYRERQLETEQHHSIPAPAPAPEASGLVLVPTEITELGYAGVLSVAHSDRKRISGYQQFEAMAELLDLGVMEDEGADKWLISSAESIALLVAMMSEGLDSVIDQIPGEYTQLKARIYAGIKDGLLDQSDMPGGAPAFVSMVEGRRGPELRLQSGFDPDIYKACLAASGRYDKTLECWRFSISDEEKLKATIKALADNPLRRMVFLLPEEEPEWLIGTHWRVEHLQTKFLELAGLSHPPPKLETSQSRVREAANREDRLAEDRGHYAGEAPPLDASTAFDEEPEVQEEKKPINTLATVRLSREGGKPYLILRSDFDQGVVSACRKVKRELEVKFPDQPRAQYNKNESGAWHFPVSSRQALSLALETFCKADCEEIGVITPSGLVIANLEQRDRLFVAMRLEAATQEAPGKPGRKVEESPPNDGHENDRRETTKQKASTAMPEINRNPDPEPIIGTVELRRQWGKREIVLKTKHFDRQVVASCKRIKGVLDQAHPEQERATFNREKDSAWRFPVHSDKALDDAISALCHETLPRIAVHTSFGTDLLTPENQLRLSRWLYMEASTAGARPGPQSSSRPERRTEKPQQAYADKAQYHERGAQGAGQNKTRKERPRPEREIRTPAQARLTFHQGHRNDFFKLRMTHYDPEITEICQLAYGEQRRRDRSWCFPIFSTIELCRTLETICGNDLGRIDVCLHGEGDKDNTIKASPENCSTLVRYFNDMRAQSRPEHFEKIEIPKESYRKQAGSAPEI